MLQFLALAVMGGRQSPDLLYEGFLNPPPAARTRAYWWWLNGNVDRPAIARDLREMAAKGFGGAILADAGGADQRGNAQVPHGPDFNSPAWRSLFKFSLEEAEKNGLEISLNIQSGWNLGGPTVQASDAPKKLVWSETIIEGGAENIRLPKPQHSPALYIPIATLAYPVPKNYSVATRGSITNWQEKALITPLRFSAPDTSNLLVDIEEKEGEVATTPDQVVDVSVFMSPDGRLNWTPTKGRWEILRIGATLNDHCYVSTHSEGGGGYAIDPFDKGAFDRYWSQNIAPLMQEVRPHLGKSLKYLHTDSWEVEVANWTPTLMREFQIRRGYDLRPFLPVLMGRIVESRDATNRVLFDFRRTMGDLAIDHHYRPFRDYAHKLGLQIHPESGGPHAVPIDSLQCLGFGDAPMSEFWASAKTHRIKDEDRFFVKQPASAAHTYGHNLVMAEGFTTIGPHWQETIWDNLRPNFDRAICEGMNRLVWHAFVCSPESEGIPGQQYFAGTHFNPNTTWWEQSRPFIDYMNRCQYMMQQGLPSADVLYYYGDNVPNFTQLRSSDPAQIGPNEDYDVATKEVILKRLAYRHGQFVLPNGKSYSKLVLPRQPAISLAVLLRVRQWVLNGANVELPPYFNATGYDVTGKADHRVRRITDEILTTRQVHLISSPIYDFKNVERAQFKEWTLTADSGIKWIERETSNERVLFLSNQKNVANLAKLWIEYPFRAEIWDPETGNRFTPEKDSDGNPEISFKPYGSLFVVIRSLPKVSLPNPPRPSKLWGTILGNWTVSFDPKWGGPEKTTFDKLIDWTTSENPGIRYYSGTATYSIDFDAPTTKKPLWLDLGSVRELAEVRVNGRSLGTAWSPPFRLPVTVPLKPTGNRLEIRVTNFWPNRIIGDAILGTHFTKTNIRQLTADTPLMPSGLYGPVTLISE